MRIFYFVFIATILFSQCTGSSKSKEGDVASDTTATATKVDVTPTVAPTPLPSVPEELMERLWNETDYIDYVFFSLNFSMNQSEKIAIQGALKGISRLNVALNPNCKPIGRIFFVAEGVNVAEADIFFSNGCQYYAFAKGSDYIYANAMTPAGVQSYTNIFNQVKTMGQ